MGKTLKKPKTAFFKDNRFVFLSGICAFVIMMLVYYCYDLIPFGDMTILRMDLYHQYGPLFAELYDRITSGGSLLYSWESGLGSSFLGNFLNYLSSPVTLIILFFGHENIPEAIATMILIKAVLSACAFTYYLKASMRQHSAATAAFGVLYAFCGYFVAYYWNVMWLDAMYLFPFVILGIERIIRAGKPTTYCISLVLCFISNYYMAYMVCIFSVLYFLTYYFANYPLTQKFHEFPADVPKKPSVVKRLRNSVFFCSGWKFAFYSVVAVGLVAVLLLPLIEVLSNSSATSGTAPTTYKKYFAVFDFLANHLAANEPTIRSSGTDVLPNVYCGVLTLILVPLFLFCKKIPVREKVSYVCLLAVLYFSFNINYLNFFWHGFHFPNDLPYRFSFMYSFILLQMAYKAFVHIREFSGNQILATGIGLVGFIVLVEKITSKNIDDISLLVSLVFAVLYVGVLYLFRNKKFMSSVISILLLCSVVSEIALANTDHYTANQSKESYTSDYTDFREIKAKLDEYDGSFYRMELTDLRTRMDPCWYNYNGVSVFSSMAYEKVANIQQDVGMFGNYINSYTYRLQTPVYNAMFGLKYIVDNDDTDMNPLLYKELFSNGEFTAYENLYNLPIAFACNADVADWSSKEADNPFLAQQQWFYYATGVDNVFRKLSVDYIDYNNVMEFLEADVESGNISFVKEDATASASFTLEITPERTENVYIYVKSNKTDSGTVSANLFSKTFNTSEGYVLDLGIRQAGETIFVDIPIKNGETSGTVEFYAYSLDTTAFKKGYATLADDGQLSISSYSDTEIVGSITAAENEIVYTSIPYDTNWYVYVDGKRVYSADILSVSDGLLAFRVGAGTHTVTLRYASSGLQVGSIITCIFIVLTTFLIICRRREWLFYKPNITGKWSKSAPDDEQILDESATEQSDIAEFLDLDIIVEDTRKSDRTKDVSSDEKQNE
ncbi:MAG: YfhO family protein [Candidatus Fimenecus sp.]